MPSPRAPITVDGALVGYLSLSWSEEIPIGDGLPPSVGLGTMAPSPGDVGEHGHPSRHGMSDSHAPEKHGPTFRPGLTPRGSAAPAKPEHFTTSDVRAALENKGTSGSEYLKHERKWIGDELAAKPELKRRLQQVIGHEQNVENAAPVAEALFNRLNYLRANGQPNLTLEEYLNRTGSNQFYGPIRKGSGPGGYEEPGFLRSLEPHRAGYEGAIQRALGGSNLVKGYTDQGGPGDPNYGKSKVFYNREGFGDFGGAGSWREEQQRRVRQGGGSVPIGVTRLPASQKAMSSGVPADVLHGAANLVAHGNSAQLQRWMAAQGHPQSGAWCGEFAADVIRGMGGTPPAGSAVASNWRRWGSHVDIPQAGDVLSRLGTPIGSTGGHAAVVEGYDPNTQSVTIFQGNPAARYTMPLSAVQRQYDIRRGNFSTNGSAATKVHPEGARKVHPETIQDMMAGMPEKQALAQARSMAARSGFDPKKVIAGEKQYIFKVGKGPGVEEASAAATFSPDSGLIRLYPKNLTTKTLPGILTHEMFHAKVNDYVKKHGWPSTKEILSATAQPEGPVFRGTGEEGKRPRSIGPGAGRVGNLVSDYGQEYLKAIPQGPVFRGYKPGIREDGIGPASGKKESAQDALNENLAEMARIKYESGGRASYPKRLEAIYDKIEKAWKSRK